MQKVTILNNQSLLDIAIQITGKSDNFLKIAKHNGLSPVASLTPGQEITIPEGLNIDTGIARYYLTNELLPATSVDAKMQEEITSKNCQEELNDCFK